MAAPNLPFFKFPQPSLRHLEIPFSPNRVNYLGQGLVPDSPRNVERAQHAEFLRGQIGAVEQALQVIQENRLQEGLPQNVDIILELESAPGFPLSADHVHALTTNGPISLLNVRSVVRGGEEVTKISIHVPYGSLTVLAEKIRRYGEELTRERNVPHQWFANLQRIAIATIEALWSDIEPIPQDEIERWWQLWVRRGHGDPWGEFIQHAQRLNIRVKPDRLEFPERIVCIAFATRSQLAASIDLLNTLAEIRIARPCLVGLTELSGDELHEWIDEALNRIDAPDKNAPAVCLLDSGVNRGHRLIENILAEADNHTVFGDGDASDSIQYAGHGTLMAGLAIYSDLRALMMSTGNWYLRHRLEAVKIIDPNRPHEPENYGSIVRQGVFLPEVTAPSRNRVYTLAITAVGPNDGRPSAWSAAIDAAAFGAEEDDEPKRLFFISAGNVDVFGIGPSFEYPTENLGSQIEDPAHAWNAITVGAITHRTEIQEGDAESQLLRPIAAKGHLSPFSRTSESWDSHWPIKPEIVMEGGNAGRHPVNGPERRDSLDLLSTPARGRPINTMRATSAATALASGLAASLQATYPDYWPETIRGLVIHSARWSDNMLGAIDPFGSLSREERSEFQRILRMYGYGEPDIDRASFSSEQEVTLLRQDEITPYKGSAGQASINDCHIHHLRLPANLLRSLGATTCKMRLTLSYFTAPNPSLSNRIGGSRYRYGGALLRFRVRHKDESITDFESQVSREAAEEDPDAPSLSDPAWALGARLRGKAGALVHDVWSGSAADLAQMDRIAVYPVKGWWASKTFERSSAWYKCHQRKLRYSLIASVEVEADVPLYTEIRHLISVPLEAELEA